MRFCVLYHQTMGVCFTGVYQQWATYALKPESVSEMHFHANSKKLNLWEKPAVDKSACIKVCV